MDQEPARDARVTSPHAFSVEQTLARLDASRADGLSSDEVARRLELHGRNALPPQAGRGPFRRFLLQFHNVLIYVLLGAGIVTAVLGQWIDSGVIFGVVVVNALIGFIQEGKTGRALDAIRNMLSLHAQVLRDGRRRDVLAEELATGCG